MISSEQEKNKNIEIGKRIKQARKRNGLTQKGLAKAIGRTESSISEYENGSVEVPRSILDRIADALGVGVYEFTIDGNDIKVAEEFANSSIADGISLDQLHAYALNLATLSRSDPSLTKPESREMYESFLREIRPAERLDAAKRKNALNSYYNLLNTDGQTEAVKRVEELTEVPRYQKHLDKED